MKNGKLLYPKNILLLLHQMDGTPGIVINVIKSPGLGIKIKKKIKENS
jgi:hypothetical protein